LADEKTNPSSAPAAPESEDFAEYEAWRRAREAGDADEEDTQSEAPARPAAESAEEADTSDQSPEGEDSEPDEDEQAAEQPRRKGGFQRRIDKLVREKRELEARLAALEQRLAGGEHKPPAGEAADGTKQTPAASDHADGKPRPEDFDTYEAYTEALTDWKLEQRERQRAQQEAERRVFDSWMARIEAARREHPDFDEVVDSDVPVSEAMQRAILESDQGAEVAYWLGKHPEEAARIAKLSPIAAIREIGRIEASLAKPSPSPKPKATVTRAPKPVSPVSGGKAGGSASVYDDSLAEDYTAWERARRAELKRRAT
jgi:hypothetical protein